MGINHTMDAEVTSVNLRKQGGDEDEQVVAVDAKLNVDGRTKPDAHWNVLPLCAGHHQDGTGLPGLVAVHPWKRRFEARYGSQAELQAKCRAMLERVGES